MAKILFRCDAGNIKNLGTGHLMRSIFILNYLKKRIKKLDYIFLCKTKNKYAISKKILLSKKIKYQSIGHEIKIFSYQESKIINKIKPDIIIFDQLDKPKKTFFNEIDKKTKIITIDSQVEKFEGLDLMINPMNHIIRKQKNILSGFQYNIISEQIYKPSKKNKKYKNNFISFGGFDYKNIVSFVKPIVLKNKHLNFFINSKFKKKFSDLDNVNFFDHNNYYKIKSKCCIAIISGGITLIEAIYFGIFTISIPQYKHQLENIRNLEKRSLTKLLTINKSSLDFINNFFENDYSKNKLIKKFKHAQIKFKKNYKGKVVLNKIYKLIKKK